MKHKIYEDIQKKEIREALDALPDDSQVSTEEYVCDCPETMELWRDRLKRAKSLVTALYNRWKVAPVKDTEGMYGDLLEIVPVSPKSWNSLVGVEHDYRTLWFKQGYRMVKRESGWKWFPIDFTCEALVPLIRSAAYNAFLAEHVMFTRGRCGRVMEGAVSRAIANEIRSHSELHGCLERKLLSRDLLNRFADECGREGERLFLLFRTLYDSRMETHTGILAELFDAKDGRGAVNRELRYGIVKGLVEGGIADCGSRCEQERMIATACADSRLKEDSVQAIRRRLSRMLIEGVVVLMPYSKAELAERTAPPADMRKRKENRSNIYNDEQRAKGIKRYRELIDRKANGYIPTPAERVWMSNAKKKYRLEA